MRLLSALVFLLCTLALPAADRAAKPVLLYSRAFNAAGESRYLPDGTYKAVLEKLREEFTVRVESNPPTARSLAGVNVVLIANPSDQAVSNNPAPHHFSKADSSALVNFVEKGGGLIVMGN